MFLLQAPDDTQNAGQNVGGLSVPIAPFLRRGGRVSVDDLELFAGRNKKPNRTGRTEPNQTL